MITVDPSFRYYIGLLTLSPSYHHTNKTRECSSLVCAPAQQRQEALLYPYTPGNAKQDSVHHNEGSGVVLRVQNQ